MPASTLPAKMPSATAKWRRRRWSSCRSPVQPGPRLFSQIGAAGRTEGADSAAYTGAARQVDGHLRQIARLVNLSTSVLIVTSDHGVLKSGQIGGNEPDLTRLPFAMIGQNVIPGDYSSIDQVDLAPTVAALLGTRLPTAAQGHRYTR